MSTGVNKSFEESKNVLKPRFDPVVQIPVANVSPSMQIEMEFNALGGLAILGVAQGDASPTLNNSGYYQNFANGWSIFWSASTGAHEVHGDIRNKWAEFGYERGFLGFPLTNETGTPDGIGRYNHFQGGSIYWTPSTGAHEVHGDIRNKWAELGWERGYLGYPITDEHDCPPGRCSDFQNGTISWTPQGGAQDKPQMFVVNAPDITFGTGIAAGGHGSLSLASNGVATFQGQLHDSGFPSYDFLAVFTVKDSAGQSAYTASHTGRLHGTDEPGSRDGEWNETISSDSVKQNWPLIRSGTGGWKVEVTSDWSPQKIAEDVLSVVGTAVGIVALFI